MFDLMSYCSRGNDFARWISPRGWNNLSGWRVEAPETRMGGSVSNRAKGSERLLQVTAIEANDGTLGITGVSPTTVASPPGDPNSPYVLQALGAKHAVLTSRRVDAEGLTESHGRIISGTVPAPPGTRQVFLRHGNQIGTVWNASPNPPSVDLIRPRASTRASRSSLVVRWQASDPDGGPLEATIEYSANGGKTWTGVYVGPESGRASIPRSMLTGSKRARVRVRLDDGFSEDVAKSKRFTVVPPRPKPRIAAPAGKVKIRADAPLDLRGDAIGAAGRRILGKRLRWFDDDHRLGRGSSLTVRSLGAGRHRITLKAVQSGRTGRAHVRVKVRAVKPAFLRLHAPPKVSRRARSVRLRVASTVKATLRAGGERFHVSPHARRVDVPIDRGKRKLRLRLKLHAGGMTTRRVLKIPRG
jgi:hypothetical protein